jgi:hypothetical protein
VRSTGNHTRGLAARHPWWTAQEVNNPVQSSGLRSEPAWDRNCAAISAMSAEESFTAAATAG